MSLEEFVNMLKGLEEKLGGYFQIMPGLFQPSLPLKRKVMEFGSKKQKNN